MVNFGRKICESVMHVADRDKVYIVGQVGPLLRWPINFAICMQLNMPPPTKN